MTQILSPFTVQLKHPWAPSPVWQTFWTHTEAQAIARATTLYTSLDGTAPQIIKVVALHSDQAIMPPKVRRHNAAIVSRSEHNDQKVPETRGFSQKNPKIRGRDSNLYQYLEDVQEFLCGHCPWFPPSQDYSKPPTPTPMRFIGTKRQAVLAGWRMWANKLCCPQCSQEMKLPTQTATGHKVADKLHSRFWYEVRKS